MPKDPTDLSFLSGGGEMGERMRAFDWSSSPVGPAAQWPQSLKTAVSICIGSRYPIVIWWGNPEYTMFYNDGYIPILGVTKHPGWLGRSGREAWKEIWSTVGPMLDSVFQTGEATWSEDLLLVMDRNLRREENYFTFSYSPIRGDKDKIDGIFCACYETTRRVVGERRLQTLRDLGRIEVKSAEEACQVALNTLAANPHDVPFALVYLLDDDAREAHLICASGIENDTPAAPALITMTNDATWPLHDVFETGTAQVVADVEERFGSLPGGPWPESCNTALILPIGASGYARPSGFLVAGFSPRRILDAEYRSFFELVVGHISTAISNARAFQEERKRAEALAEIDRAKTAFFSNVSHEFRTPLTLMIGPLEETLADTSVSAGVRDRLDVAHRNSVRLLKLVNTLLDFSRIEAGRIEAVYEAVDLQALTLELASMFRSAIEKAGLKLIVEGSPLEAEVYVDREMWEKIVFNLLSNAFKFTFEGEITVRLKKSGENVELEVSDTGTGIPEGELSHLFERFHRVKGARGRSYEGSGIGLALVQELVKLHGGAVRVKSEVGKGSTFTVSIPTGSAHLPADDSAARVRSRQRVCGVTRMSMSC
jgi:signal transduction histidine kinase